MAPVIVPYETELEEIFGDKPIVSSNHTIHLGVPKDTTASQTESEEYTNFEILDGEMLQGTLDMPTTPSVPSTTVVNHKTNKSQPHLSPSTSSYIMNSPSSSAIVHSNNFASAEISNLNSPKENIAPNSTPTPPSSSRKRKTAKEIHFESKLKLKKEAIEAATIQRADFFKSAQEGMQEKWKMEAETNKVRLEILKKIQKNLDKN